MFRRPPLGLLACSLIALSTFGAAQESRLSHRAFVPPNAPVLSMLQGAGAVARIDDYGSFLQLTLDPKPLGGRAALAALGLELHDEQSVIWINGLPLDTADPARLSDSLATIPAAFRTSPVLLSGLGLWLVQFRGPVKEWYFALERSGAAVITPMASNAYVVSVDTSHAASFAEFLRHEAVAWAGAYEPWFKLSPELRGLDFDRPEAQACVIQFLNDEHGAAALLALRELGLVPFRPSEEILAYLNVHLVVPLPMIAAIAAHPGVFAIESFHEERMSDEAQGQIMAGNVNAGGTAPSGPGYLAWLTSKGFTSSQFNFAVDVTDDGIDRGSTTDINVEFRVLGTAAGATRLVYLDNYTNDPLTDSGEGHGNINASIVAGYNDLTGAAAEDPSGFNYGLGVCPYVSLGNTKVFNNAGASQFLGSTSTRLSAAYGGNARISSNSWVQLTTPTYTSAAQAHDTIVRDALSGTPGNQEMSIIFAAGNDGSAAGSIRPPGTAKNLICVGAAEGVRAGGVDGCGISDSGANSAMDIISFSSRGPTSDGRFRPDIMAPGTHIQGAASRSLSYNGNGVCDAYWPLGQTLYCWSSGTSHACPAIAGAAALARQYFINQAWGTPSPAMVKAFLMSSSRYMTGTGANDTIPSNNQGVGRADLGRAFDGVSRVRLDQTQLFTASGQTHTVSGSIATGAQPFRVALVWTDVPGPTTGNAYVNNLDLEVTVNGTLYRGNVFSGASSTTGGTADVKNNAEFVFLPAGTTGAFSATVKATALSGNGVPGNASAIDQDFALLVYNGLTCAPPSITTPPASQSVCVGSPANFSVSATAGAGATYQWRKGGVNIGGATSTTYAIASVVSGDAGDYDVVITDSCASVASPAATLTVPIPPGIFIGPSGGTQCAGTQKTFSVLASGTGPLSFQWRKNTNNIAGATASSYAIASVSAGDAGSYDVVVTNSCGSVTSGPAVLTVNTAPSVTTPPASATVCAGAMVTFNVSVSGTSPTYQWRKNTSNIGGATSSSYSIASVATGDAGSYDVIVSNGCGSATSAAAILGVNTAPQIGTHPASQTLCVGGMLSLSVVASGTTPLSYQWRKGGVAIGGATAASYSIASLTTGDAGSFDVVVTNACNSATSNAATIVVNEAPLIGTQPVGQTLCVGGSFMVSVAATGTAPLTYQWRKNGSSISGATSPSYSIASVAANSGGSFDVVVTNSCGSDTSAAAVLTVNTGPHVTTHPASQALCSGSPFTVFVVVNGTAPLTYQWRRNSVPISGATSSSYSIAAIATSDAGAYDVIVTNLCNSVTSADGILTVDTPPLITAQPQPISVCATSMASFSATASGTAPLTYQWRKDGVPILGATASTFDILSAVALDEGAYDVVVTNACGSIASTPATLSVDDPAILSLSPQTIAVMTAQSPPIILVVTGTCFVPTSSIYLNGLLRPTTFVSSGTLSCVVDQVVPQALIPGGICVNVANAPEAVSNSAVLVVGGGNNVGTIRRQPLAPLPGESYAVLFEGGVPFAPLSLFADLGVVSPLVGFPDPVTNYVLSVSPFAGSLGPFIPIFDGIGLFNPPDGTAFGPDGRLSIPGWILPNPPLGITATVQAIYIDLANPIGFTLTWARYPELLSGAEGDALYRSPAHIGCPGSAVVRANPGAKRPITRGERLVSVPRGVRVPATLRVAFTTAALPRSTTAARAMAVRKPTRSPPPFAIGADVS